MVFSNLKILFFKGLVFLIILIISIETMFLSNPVPKKSIDQDQVYFQQGLPNLVNTCYINSIIQLLYSSQKIHIELQNTKKINPTAAISRNLSQVFEAISLDKGMKQKEKRLNNFIKSLNNLQSGINFHFQQDLLQVMMLLLNQLFEQNDAIRDLFKIQCQYSCDCNKYKIYTYFLQYNDQFCSGCKKKIQLTLLKQNQLIILKANDRKLDMFIQFNQSQYLYKCIGRVFYRGNSIFGHYTASRLCGENFLQFNDSIVFREQGNKLPRYQLFERYQNKQVLKKDKLREHVFGQEGAKQLRKKTIRSESEQFQILLDDAEFQRDNSSLDIPKEQE